MSTNFGDVDLEHLTFPAVMSVDWVRVYQPKNAINIGCDPEDFPTSAYINQYVFIIVVPMAISKSNCSSTTRYLEAYTNPNLTTWRDDYGQPFPKNSFLEQC